MMQPRLTHRALVTFATISLLTAACGRSSLRRAGGDIDTDGSTDVSLADAADRHGDDVAGIQALSISPDATQVMKGEEVSFAARLHLKDGSSMDATSLVEWSTSDATIAASRGAGVFAGLELGSITVTARLGALQDTAQLAVGLPARVAVINIDPPSPTLIGAGSTLQLHAWATYDSGERVDVTSLADWASSNASVLTVSAGGGKIAAVAPGHATVRAEYGGVGGLATASVTTATVSSMAVSPVLQTVMVGGKASFNAEATLSDGTHQDVTANAIWTSSVPGVASVLGGVATSLQPGKTTIGALLNGVEGRAQLTVSSAALQRLEIAPLDPKVGVGVSLRFSATGHFSDGSARDVTSQVTWASSSAAVLAIGGAGLARSVAAGTSVVTAALSGLQAASTVTVSTATLKSIKVTPPSATLALKGALGLTATGTYDDGSTAELTASVIWNSSPQGVVSVDNVTRPGLVTALAAGVATVTASLGVVSGSASIVVSSAALVKLTVTPSSASVVDGLNLPLRATGTYADGLVLDVTGQAMWSSSDSNVASVSNATGLQGLVTGVRAGKATVTATLGGVAASASITVTAATLTRITVSPVTQTLAVGRKLQYVAVGTYSDGTTSNITAQASWTTGDSSVATVGNAGGTQGQVSARGTGTTTVTAALGGVTGTATVTVTDPVRPRSVRVTPSPASAALGSPLQLAATAVYDDGSTRAVTTAATWASSDTGVAVVSSASGSQGLATTWSAGVCTISATYQGVTGSSALTVKGATIRSIRITPASPSMPLGYVQQLAAIATYTDSTTADVTAQASWSSSAPGVVSVGDTAGDRGMARAIAAGSATVRAQLQGTTGSTVVTAADVTLKGIAISPATVTTTVNGIVQLSASGTFSDGIARDMTSLVTWSSSNAAVADVGTTAGTMGQARAFSPGLTTIGARRGAVQGTATITVQ